MGEQNRQAQIAKRLSTINIMGANLIVALTIAALWGAWRLIAIIVALHVVMILFNTWVALFYLPQHPRTAEIVRNVTNTIVGIFGCHLVGWPLPAWLWLPFTALAHDHLDRRMAQRTLVALCVGQSSVAIWDGVPWIYPLSFTLLAFFCAEISRLRLTFIREMLQRSDQQRLQIEQANVQISHAHEQLKAETQQRLQLEIDLHQAQKMESVGRLAAGVAHEINTPIQFVNDSISFLQEATHDLMTLVEKQRAAGRSVLAGAPSKEAASAAEKAEEEADLPYLAENIPHAFDLCLDGLSRVATIVHSLKEFAHPDAKEMMLANLNRAIESTLAITRHEYKYVAEVETDLAELPLVMCHVGDINQVVLNIVVNAAHAIGDVVQGTDQKGRISVRTRPEGEDVVISIGDTGRGILESIQDCIFDPFFTTKEVGKGTGQGLAIARSVIVDRHRGQLTFTTEVGQGTTFFIRLPVHGPSRQT